MIILHIFKTLDYMLEGTLINAVETHVVN